MDDRPHVSDPRSGLDATVAALARLDARLAVAVAMVQQVLGRGPEDDPFRGLYVADEDVEALLAGPAWHVVSTNPSSLAGLEPPWNRLAETFDLSPFDLDTVLIGLAPEIDLRYERIFAYLQNDVTRKRPTVDLALSLLSATTDEKAERRRHFTFDGPLVRHAVIHLDSDSGAPTVPFLARAIRVDQQIVSFLLDEPGCDADLAAFCDLISAPTPMADLPLDGETKAALSAVAVRAAADRHALPMLFSGPPGSGRRAAAAALALACRSPLLAADLHRAPPDSDASLIRRVFREAWRHHAIPYLSGITAVAGPSVMSALIEALLEYPAPTVVATDEDWIPPPLPWSRASLSPLRVRFAASTSSAAHAAWRVALADHGVAEADEIARSLADRVQLTPGAATEAVGQAVQSARWRQAVQTGTVSDAATPVTVNDLLTTAKTQCRQDITPLAIRIEPVFGWDDIVLSDPVRRQLEEICQRVVHRRTVMHDWGFADRMSLGRGVSVLFSGQSGTGKTMAAEVIARETGLDLYKIDLSGIVSKYIGETEKNLDRIFASASAGNAILFFDEADALFGKRSEVRDSHDRYANVEISYLLQKMESFDGLAILATNLRQNMDTAFTRRLSFVVTLPLPDASQRRRIWEQVWPDGAPRAETCDLDDLATRFKLSGGNIRNAAVAAAFFAAADGAPIGHDHLLHAVRREYQKMGKSVPDEELFAGRIVR